MSVDWTDPWMSLRVDWTKVSPTTEVNNSSHMHETVLCPVDWYSSNGQIPMTSCMVEVLKLISQLK